ncbi:MAG: DUF4160 domain-containing protein [Chitinophagaceae bacterium]|nr:DUF4160 domain-containing protein [Chitinophagaceae bacterium]
MPIHVHVSFAEFESKLELEYENGTIKEVKIQKVKGRKPLPEKELKDAVKFVRKYQQIVDKWTTFFVKNKKVKCEVINQKIR